jgi:AraC family transcriptional regulator
MTKPAFHREQPAHSPVRRVGGLILQTYRYGPDRVVPRHDHSLAYFTFVAAGGFDEAMGTTTRSCTWGHLVFYPEGEEHANRFHRGGGEVLRVDVEPALLARLREHGPLLTRPAVLTDAPASSLGSRLHREFHSHDPGSELAIEGLSLELLSLTQRAGSSSSSPAWLLHAEESLRARYAEPVSLKTLADEIGIHPSHLARAFRARHGCTMGEFVRRIRIQHARARLRQRGTDLAALAVELGFADQSHFGRVFKRCTGLTPAAYRRSS